MIYSVYPNIDATIYEYFPNRNTGIDPILEITKYTANSKAPNGDIFTSNYNSRVLIKFPLADISASIVAGTITNPRFYLKLSAIDSTDLPIDYTLYAYPVSQSWQNGNGNFNDSPEIRNGVSWNYKTSYDLADRWATGSYNANTTASWYTNPGGATWYFGSGYEASQSFSYESPDIRMDVTDIVNKWLSGTVTNNGFIVKRSTADESSSDIFGQLKFFGRDTHTIYVPRLEAVWSDSDLSGTGSFSQIADDRYVVYLKNIRDSYKEASKIRFRVGVRPEFPVLTYATSSNYLTQYRLPLSASYAVKDAATEEYLIDFDDNYTKLSCDTNGNYFDLWLNGFLPERFYKILIKAVHTDQTVIHDNGFYFKVTR